ncbi:MAG TPA: CsgG/HfaB family protein [Verrucomicrobiae bacterium]|nr:CsgG/HfaB family protein [Verrucomicrobiae bacterium]
MKRKFIAKACTILGLTIFVTPSVLRADKATLGIAPVKSSPSLVESTKRDGKSIEMGQVVEALDGQLIDRINATRKFELVSRSDLKEIHAEQDYANSGNVDAKDKSRAQQFKEAGAKYLLVTTVDGFKDYSESSVVGETGQNATIRVLSLSTVAKIYDSTTAKLLESANFQIRKEQRLLSLKRGNENSALSDDLLVGVARDMAEKVANRVADVIYPAKIISKIDKQVTINRGDGTGVAVDQIWNVYATGKELKDPDTGEILGVQEVLVGKVRVTSVLPKVSTADIVGEDTGIAEGAIVRLPQMPH